MKRPEDPLEWPSHFPPTDAVKKFFIGVRWLGPDLRFFRELCDQQAARTTTLMAAWPTVEERAIALLMGRHFRHSIGWKSEVFLPYDRVCVIAYGPRFVTMDNDFFEESLVGIRKDLCMDLPDAFWQQTVEWCFQDVVRAVLKRQEEVT